MRTLAILTLTAAVAAAQIPSRTIETRRLGAARRTGASLTADERASKRVVVMQAAVALDPAMSRAGLAEEPDVETIQWWALKYAEADGSIEHVPWPWSDPVRGIAEVRTPATPAAAENQKQELAAAKAAGYDTAFCVWRGEDPEKLTTIMQRLRETGWRTILAYGPGESHQPDVYRDPEELAEDLAALVQYADAFYPCWRWLSIGHWSDTSYAAKHFATLVGLARQTRPALPVLGEVFVSHRSHSLEWVNCEGVSAWLVVNAGYRNIVPAYWAGKVAEVTGTELPLLAVIVGRRPYYASWKRGSSDTGSEWPVKRALEKRFRAEGFSAGTITLVGDGSDTRTQGGRWKPLSDSMTHSSRRREQNETGTESNRGNGGTPGGRGNR